MWEIEHGLCACTERSIIDRTGAQTMLYLTCTTISSVDLAQYGVSLAKDWVSVECGTMDCYHIPNAILFAITESAYVMMCFPRQRLNGERLSRPLPTFNAKLT